MAVEEVAEGVESADAPFGGGREVGLGDGEVGEALDGPPAASRAVLLDLTGRIVRLAWLLAKLSARPGC